MSASVGAKPLKSASLGNREIKAIFLGGGWSGRRYAPSLSTETPALLEKPLSKNRIIGLGTSPSSQNGRRMVPNLLLRSQRTTASALGGKGTTLAMLSQLELPPLGGGIPNSHLRRWSKWQ